MKGYRFTNGILDRRPLGLEDIPHIPLPYEMVYLENNTSLLGTLSGFSPSAVMGPDPLVDDFNVTSYHLYGESTNEFMSGLLTDLGAPFNTWNKIMEVLLYINNGTLIYVFRDLLVADQYPSVNAGGILWRWGYNVHLPIPVKFTAGNKIQSQISGRWSVVGTKPVDFFVAVAGYYE